MNYDAKEYYYIKFLGYRDEYLDFGIGIDSEEIIFHYLIERRSIEIYDARITHVYRTIPNRTDSDYSDEHKKLFDQVWRFLNSSILDHSYLLLDKKFYVNAVK